MKKMIALLTVFLMVTACSNDDDASTDGDDPILGTWFLVDWDLDPLVEGGPSECNMESNIAFNADNSADSEFYENVEGSCVSESESGEWERLDNGRYSFNIPLVGQQTGTVEFDGNNRFTFSVTGGSMTFEK